MIPEPFTPRTHALIGRDDIINAIRKAIDDPTKRSHAIYISGVGGIGKTRVLEEVAELQKAAPPVVPFRWTGIIDLYHTSYHSRSGLRQAIMDGLDPQNQYFPTYRRLSRDFEEKRQAGLGGKALEKLRDQLDEAFHQEYDVLARQQRLVLCFDTIELIQYESDIVQQIGQIQDIDTIVKNWLLNHVSRFPNTVTLFAGRPRPNLQADFQREFERAERIFSMLKLAAFSPAETDAYLDELCKHIQRRIRDLEQSDGNDAELRELRRQNEDLAAMLTQEIRERIFRITRGRPIYLALLFDLMLHGDTLNIIFPLSSGLDIPEEMVGERLIERLLELPDPFGPVIYYLAHARKGLDADLLHHLMGKRAKVSSASNIDKLWSDAQIQENLAQVRNLAFVKTRPGTEQLFLHDEVYDLFDRYFQHDAYSPSYRETYRTIARYYRHRLDAEPLEEREALEELIVTLLYYELQVDVRAAYYQHYVRWDEEAIKSHKTGFDMRLRDEVLRFLDRYIRPNAPFYDKDKADRIDLAEIERDAAVRWVKRYIAQLKYPQAVELAETILDFGPEPYRSMSGSPSRADKLPSAPEMRKLFEVDDPLFWSHLLTYYGEVLAYQGDSGVRIVSALEKAIELLTPEQERLPVLEKAVKPLSEEEPADETMQLWLHMRVLGRAHNNMGYFAWSQEHYRQAGEHFRTAIHFYRQLDIRDEIADSVNNLAYVYGLLGEIDSATNLVEDALDMRRRLGQRYMLAYSMNTRGLIHNFAHQPHRALPQCWEALRIFEELHDRRGIGIACLAIGHTWRLIANQWQEEVYTPEQSRERYDKALESLSQAIDEIAAETSRLIEAYNERGAIHRDRAILEQAHGRREDAEEHFELALQDFERSLKYAGQSFPADRADSLEDIADVYFRRGQYAEGEEQQMLFAKATSYLDEAEKLVPDGYHLAKGQGFPEVENPIETMWQVMGKLHLLRGNLLIEPFSKRTDMQEDHYAALLAATTQYTFAVIYLFKFTANWVAHQLAMKAIYKRLKVYGVKRLKEVCQRVETVASDYCASADPLLEMIDKQLGIRSDLLD